MTGLLGDIFLEILQLTKFLEPVTIGPCFSKMHMPMSGSATFVKGVVEDNLKQLDH